jgi:hypothetical protein
MSDDGEKKHTIILPAFTRALLSSSIFVPVFFKIFGFCKKGHSKAEITVVQWHFPKSTTQLPILKKKKKS